MEELGGNKINSICVENLTNWADYFLIADFQSSVQRRSVYEELLKISKEEGFFVEKQTNYSRTSDDWIVLDADIVICHIMSPEMRESYKLENLWSEEKILEE